MHIKTISGLEAAPDTAYTFAAQRKKPSFGTFGGKETSLTAFLFMLSMERSEFDDLIDKIRKPVRNEFLQVNLKTISKPLHNTGWTCHKTRARMLEACFVKDPIFLF